VARVFTAMGSEVIAYTASPRKTREERRDKGFIVPGTGDPEGEFPVAWFSGTTRSALETFLRAKLDLLIISLPLTPSTSHLFGRTEFEILKSANENKGCFIVNISRGSIIRQSELVECLNDGTLAGAAVDVTDPEPLPEGDALWTAKNVFVSPHVSALGREYFPRAYDVLSLNLERLENGEGLVNEVRRKRGY
jgi:phosphoglycerate dehydrogenase-like enzyme